MEQQKVGVALIGGGTVGGGVARVLTEQRELLARRTGLSFEVRHVVVRDARKARDYAAPVHGDVERAISDPHVGVVAELIGGTTMAGDVIIRALRAGKRVVTANKALLAERGPELFDVARECSGLIGFEASCAGGIPIIAALSQGLVGNRIDALVGIVNGTCNYILTEMTRAGMSYSDALAAAQRLGFAEADPTMDVSGRDAAQKLTLLASLAFDTRVRESDLAVEGIDTLDAADIRYAGELGYVVKLLGIAERKSPSEGAALSLRVAPTLVPEGDMLATVSGSFNAVSIYGSAVGHSLFYGRGAGALPTASAVVADIVAVARGRDLPVLRDRAGISLLPIDRLVSRYYLRLVARDEPGVLAQVSQVLGDERISIASFLQHESPDPRGVPMIFTTHHATEGAVRRAMARIDALDCIAARSVCLRVLDVPREFGA